LPLDGSGDDFDKLAGIVNTMLEQIERLMDEIKAAGDNIAHDLRTPLTSMQSATSRTWTKLRLKSFSKMTM